MNRTILSSKGQLTIPVKFREQMNLTGSREVELEQLPDGSVVVRPVKSILHLAGSVKGRRPPLSPEDQRDWVHREMAKRVMEKAKKQ